MQKFIFLLLLCSSTLKAQEFKPELVGTMLPAKIKFGDGQAKDVLMEYQPFESFKFPLNQFRISLSNSKDDAYNHTGGIESFMIDGNIWALRPVAGSSSNQFVILKSQGAIETYECIKYGKAGDKRNERYVLLPGDSRTVLLTRKISTNSFVQGVISNEKLKEWIADSPEATEDFKDAEKEAEAAKKKQDSLASAGSSKPNEVKKKGLLGALEKVGKLQQEANEKSASSVDMRRIINNYNAWYEQKNQGQIRYQFDSPPVWQALPKRIKSAEERKAELETKQNSLFANRTTTPSPENASAKDNLPVKKETFAAKMQRVKNDGNKIGVILVLNPVRVPKSTTTVNLSFSQPVAVEGEYVDESLKEAVPQFVQELNQALGTTDIELIDINNIPYRESKFGRMDDWWASRYKVVFAYSLDPQLRTSNEESDGKIKFTASLNMITSLIVREYVGGPGATNQDIITQVLNMGSFLTPAFAQEDQITDVKIIYEKTLEKLGMPILEKMRIERADAVKKLVEKKL